MAKKCPQCKNDMDKIKFDIGYGIEVDSLHCKKWGFNITDEKDYIKYLKIKWFFSDSFDLIFVTNSTQSII